LEGCYFQLCWCEPHQSQLNNPLLEEQFGRNHPTLDQGLPILFFYLLSTLLLPRLYMFPLLEGKQDLVEFFQQGKGPIEILPFNTPLPTTRFFSLHEKRIMMRIPDRTRYFKAEFLIVILSPYWWTASKIWRFKCFTCLFLGLAYPIVSLNLKPSYDNGYQMWMF